MAASPYVAGLSVLTDDEADLGAAVVEMGAGTTNHRDLFRRALRPCQRFRGRRPSRHHGPCARPSVHALRMPSESMTLYGTVLTGGSDARELMSVPTAGGQRA